MGTSYTEQWTDTPLDDIIPSYIYKQYQDDDSVMAFSGGINELSQGYLDWFNQTPLSVYTSPSVSGPLLDWIGNNLYGIFRPTISTSSARLYGPLNSLKINALAINGFFARKSGTSLVASDDIYRRVMTWFLFRGDGVQMSVEWVRRRIARFLFGVNGTDIDVGLIINVSVYPISRFAYGAIDSVSVNRLGMNTFIGGRPSDVTIILPASNPFSATFQNLFNAGLLPLPFQVNFTIGIN